MSFTMPKDKVQWNDKGEFTVDMTYQKLAIKPDQKVTDQIVYKKPTSSAPVSSSGLLSLFINV